MHTPSRFILALVLAFPTVVTAEEFAFSDVPFVHPNAEAIEYVKAEGMVEGYADGTFRPDATINRAEFTKIILEAIDGLESCSSTFFTDVPRDAWYLEYVCSAKVQRLIDGYPDGSFRPGNPINFVEASKILSNVFNTLNTFCSGQSPIAGPDGCDFDNRPWYEWYVRSLEYRGAIPLSIDSFDQPITRGEMAEMIYRLREVTDKKTKTYEEIRDGAGTTLPDFYVEDVKVETLDLGNGVTARAAYAKLRNRGPAVTLYFSIIASWTKPSDTRWYDDETYMGSFPSGYLGGLDRTLSEEGVDTYPWTFLKLDVHSGDTVRITLDADDEIRESDEKNNTFVFVVR